MRNAPLIFVATGVAAIALQPVAAANVTIARHDVATAFFIDKSDDHNRVDYGVRLTANCQPATNAPLFSYWRTFENGVNGRETHDLNLIENTLYGAVRQDIRERTDDSFVLEIELRNLRARPIRIRVRRQGSRCVADTHMRINGMDAQLSSAHLTLGGPGGVRSVDLIGTTPRGRPARECIVP